MTSLRKRLAKTTTLGVAALFALLTLSACGGGGGSGGSSIGIGQPPAVAPTLTDTQSANPRVIRIASAQAVGNLPNFGRVTQSSNIGSVVGVSGDTALATFDGRNSRVTVRRTDGSRLILDTGTHRVVSQTYAPVLPGYSFRGDGLLTYTGSSVSIAAVYTNWNNADPTDYLAGGYWMHLKGRTNPLTITGAEVGAFVDGPEISTPPTNPTILQRLGTATYRGRSGGLFVTESLSGAEVGEFAADVRLTANFASNTVSGCIGCGNLTFTGVAVDASGRSRAFSNANVPARLRLGAAPIAPTGTFASRNVTFERDDVTVTSSSGSWGGRFSNISTGAGDPRLAAGTFAASATDANGGRGAAVGAWFGIRN